MDERERFIELWVHESATTQKVFDRIPESSEYRPDARSRTAQEIAWQILGEEQLIIDAVENGTAEWAHRPMPASMREIQQAYARQREQIAARWRRLPADRWDGSLEFFGVARPAAPMAWSFLFDIVHHRGQITTYLRPMGSTVPQIYGPSGDEP